MNVLTQMKPHLIILRYVHSTQHPADRTEKEVSECHSRDEFSVTAPLSEKMLSKELVLLVSVVDCRLRLSINCLGY